MTTRDQVSVIGREFVHGLRRILEDKLYGLYIYGAAALPGDIPTGDIDFHVILTGPLTEDERSRLYELHDALARDFPPLGVDMDGYYIFLEDARGTQPPPQGTESPGQAAADPGQLGADGRRVGRRQPHRFDGQGDPGSAAGIAPLGD